MKDIKDSNITIDGNLCHVTTTGWVDSQQVKCIAPKGIGANVSLCASIGSQASVDCIQFSYAGIAYFSIYIF